jgi:hypothetical protein
VGRVGVWPVSLVDEALGHLIEMLDAELEQRFEKLGFRELARIEIVAQHAIGLIELRDKG